MMRRLTALGLMLAIALTVGVVAWAQEQPASPAPPAAEQPAPPAAEQPAPAPEQVAPPEQPAPQPTPPQPQSALLRMKFRPNEVMRYRIFVDVQGLVAMDLPTGAPPGMPSQLPIHMVVQGEGIGKVLRVSGDGAARLSVRAGDLSAVMEMMGQKFEMVLREGKYQVKQNGQPAESGKIPLLPKGQRIPFLQDPIEFKLSPRGEVMDIAIPGMGSLARMLPGMSMQDLMKDQILLPERPLVLGEPWSDNRSRMMPGSTTPITASTKLTLNQIETWAGGRKIANLRMESAASARDLDLGAAMRAGGAPEGMPPVAGTMSMDQQLGGTMLFDITRGVLVRFDFQMNQQMAMRASVNVPQGGPQSGNMNLQFVVKGALAKI